MLPRSQYFQPRAEGGARGEIRPAGVFRFVFNTYRLAPLGFFPALLDLACGTLLKEVP